MSPLTSIPITMAALLDPKTTITNSKSLATSSLHSSMVLATTTSTIAISYSSNQPLESSESKEFVEGSTAMGSVTIELVILQIHLVLIPLELNEN
jgi:hypothetical protein